MTADADTRRPSEAKRIHGVLLAAAFTQGILLLGSGCVRLPAHVQAELSPPNETRPNNFRRRTESTVPVAPTPAGGDARE